MYSINKKEVKHISKVFLNIIKDFAKTVKKTIFDDSELPKVICKGDKIYIILTNNSESLCYNLKTTVCLKSIFLI